MANQKGPSINELSQDNRILKEKVQRLENTLSGKKNPMSDEAIDGIIWVVIISVIVCATTFWLTGLPSS